MNLSETSFVARSWHKGASSNDNAFTLRWFTPATEVELCGHATLAGAKAIFDSMKPGADTHSTITFDTKYKGQLSATMDWKSNRISLNFPLIPTEELTEAQLKCLPQIVEHVLHPFPADKVHSVHIAASMKYLLIRLRDGEEATLLNLTPRFRALETVQGLLWLAITVNYTRLHTL